MIGRSPIHSWKWGWQPTFWGTTIKQRKYPWHTNFVGHKKRGGLGRWSFIPSRQSDPQGTKLNVIDIQNLSSSEQEKREATFAVMREGGLEGGYESSWARVKKGLWGGTCPETSLLNMGCWSWCIIVRIQ